MKLFITGGSGFIGGKLIKLLCDKNISVTACLRKGSKSEALQNSGAQIYIDSGRNEDLLEHLIKNSYDGIIHLATCYVAEHGADDIEKLVESNILFSLRILDASAKAGIKWFLNVGTFWQNYNNADYCPVNLYAATKQAFHTLALFYIETTDISFVTVKLNDTYGPGDTRPKIFNFWKKLADSGEELAMSPGEQLIDIVHVDDAVKGLFIMIELLENKNTDLKDYNNREFVISSNNPLKLKHLAELFEKAIGKRLNIKWGGREYRSREVMIPYDQGTPIPGWKPEKSLEEGIRELFYDK